jgi:hypothetical protein
MKGTVMRVPSLAVIWIFSSLVAVSALAQNRLSPADASTPPLSRSTSPTISLTEGDAKSRFEARGYSNVSGLHKDAFGIWHGTATRNGKTFKLSLDAEGKVGIE